LIYYKIKGYKLKTYTLTFNKDFYCFKRKARHGEKEINFILYSNTKYEKSQVYVFLNKEEKTMDIDYLGQFSLKIINITQEFMDDIESKKEIYITEINKSKKTKPLFYIGKIIKQ
jgi:hypothetical protein